MLYRDQDNDSGEVRVYPGKLQVIEPFVVIQVHISTTIKDLIVEALTRFGFDSKDVDDYRLSEILLDRGGWLCFLNLLLQKLRILYIHLINFNVLITLQSQKGFWIKTKNLGKL